jgi:hypothetical protein
MKAPLLILLLLFYFLSISNAQTVSIPDANFKAILLADLMINTNNDTDIQITEAMAYTGTISVANQGIVNLEGIEAFVNLTVLDCSNNALDSLDVGANTALTSLYCNACQLTNLDVTTNTSLLSLSCYNNQLSVVNLNSNLLLEEFYVYNNQLTNLDLSNQTAIRRFFAQSNQLTTLNFKNGNYMNVTHFNVISNPNLTCIEVDDIAYAITNWDHVDGGVVFSTSCFTNLNLVNDLDLIIYPNPVSKHCIIELPHTVSKVALVLYNNLGQKSMSKQYENTSQINLDLESFNGGIYWIVLNFEEHSLQYPIIKSNDFDF